VFDTYILGGIIFVFGVTADFFKKIFELLNINLKNAEITCENEINKKEVEF
jgi:hypothetical protein